MSATCSARRWRSKADGLFPGSHLRRPVLLRLGPADKVQHLIATWALALGTNFSALWILIANGWMQYPVGAHFNADTMRMEVSDFMAVLFNPVAQAKFVHTVSAGYVTGSVLCWRSAPISCCAAAISNSPSAP
jgi:hypothetical protein